ncbi:SRPBCC family protein [Streptomyces wuyuanensis]|uniref:Polyketide cyclase / dehydrase and lipid transport n=1 Tax=Streptomyces wuyuanensis TaxID=1196353 RepID=A0A1G9TVH5_9ACTN|nr:SRPBCC family protein [Streptomyces wuyuanensis]SDM51770.1 Polyketide cyclase / dehydrase and lipid transport [Streptomyces wuyuanensis]
MAKESGAAKGGEGSGLDLLRNELVDFLGAQVENLADKAGDKLSGLTDQLLDAAQNGGPLPGGGIMKAVIGNKGKGIKDNVVDKAKGLLGGGKGKRKSGGGKSMNILEVQDVGVPLRAAYDHWTAYEDFSDFAKGVRSVSKDSDDVHSDWKVKVGPSTRGWKATVQEQVPDDRIMWTSEGAKGSTRGCVSFHSLAPSLTRIVLVVEYYPSGFFEKTGNLWRAQGRRLRLDFKNFVRYVSFADEEPEGWRGEIRDGEVVRSHEEALEEEEQGQEEDEEEYEEDGEYEEDEEGDGEYADEDEEPEDGEYEDEYEEDEEEDEYAK